MHVTVELLEASARLSWAGGRWSLGMPLAELV